MEQVSKVAKLSLPLRLTLLLFILNKKRLVRKRALHLRNWYKRERPKYFLNINDFKRYDNKGVKHLVSRSSLHRVTANTRSRPLQQ